MNEEYAGMEMYEEGREIIPCTEWQVERPQRISIHKKPDAILRGSNGLEGFGSCRSRRLFFCRNVIVNFIHQL